MLSRRGFVAVARGCAALHRCRLREQSMSSFVQPTSCRGVVVCADFDQTITTRDTIALLFEAANAKHACGSDRADHVQQVEQLVAQYMEASAKLMARSLTVTDTARQFDEKGLRAFLDAFALVDLQSIRRVTQSETLKGLERIDLHTIADSVQVMEKSVDTLALASSAIVISSNWSQTMIREKLRRSGLSSVHVIANELEIDEYGVTTGAINLVVQSPQDKANFVAKQKTCDDTPVIFIGDSTSDLLAMLHADIGITLGFAVESSLARVCAQFGIKLAPLSDFRDVMACRDHMIASDQRVLFTANSWSQIHALLLVKTPSCEKE